MEEALNDALLHWLSTFCVTPNEKQSMGDVSNGVAMALALHRIDQVHFHQHWLSKVRTDIPAANNRLKANNMKKVLNGIREYNVEVLGIQFNNFPMPDIARASEGSLRELGRLIQLLLGCAVNCERKQLYIENIMNMEEWAQQLIMQAIQELIAHQTSVGASMPEMSHSDIRKTMDDLERADQDRELLKQRCHDLENQVKMLQDEKSNISDEFQKLQAQVGSSPVSSKDDSMGGIRQNKELKRKLESTQEDLYKIEKERDEMQVKVEAFTKQLEESQAKEAELQKTADQARSLKDEVDILRETADKVQKCEATIESYKKKMEELGDVKRQVKLLEEKNTKLVETNMDLEEDMRKTGNWRPQVDAYKKQMSELRSKFENETARADKLDFETKRLLEKVEALSVEKDRVVTERDKLKEVNGELQDQLRLSSGEGIGAGNRLSMNAADFDPDSGVLEMIPPSVKERLLRLEHENRRLKGSGSGDGEGGKLNSHVLQQMVDDLREREAQLESSNRKLNQKILELEADKDGWSAGLPLRIPGSREDLELRLSEADKNAALMEEKLQKKEVEMQGMEERYKKYIEKAKSVIKTLDPKQNPSSAPDVSTLRVRLTEKDRLIESMEQETEKFRSVREMEERLISSAFYNLSMEMHRAAVQSRLSNVNASSSSHGQSFLARQRQVGAAGPTTNGQNQFTNGRSHDATPFNDFYSNS